MTCPVCHDTKQVEVPYYSDWLPTTHFEPCPACQKPFSPHTLDLILMGVAYLLALIFVAWGR